MAFSVEERYDLKIKISHLYYMEDKTQAEISKMLNISRPTIVKMLKEAKQEKIVRIQIAEPRQTNAFLKDELALRHLLGVEDVKIVNVPSENRDIIDDRIGSATATYTANLLKSGSHIGFGWGRTLECFAEKVKTTNKIKDVEFIPLVGGLGTNKEINVLSNALCEKVASNFPRSTVRYLYAPMIATNILTAQAFLDSQPLKNIFDKAKQLDMAVVGIDGELGHSSTIENVHATDSDALTRGDIEDLKNAKAVGCICARFYDISGAPCNTSLNQRVIAVNTATLKSIPTVIAAAGGKYKVDAIIGAARGKLFNVLITDEYTAKGLLERLTPEEQ
ncbi:sugar-binding transcriptional regulator [Christensenella timonensis]|uniref:sugar-binding transcriptional regulator n=1 Tax=Christensenella timonensis TaxID=1816678 RepID=UPI000830EE33|nr:sugar-binding transcriptional regulator [Christensenella timonensis]